MLKYNESPLYKELENKLITPASEGFKHRLLNLDSGREFDVHDKWFTVQGLAIGEDGEIIEGVDLTEQQVNIFQVMSKINYQYLGLVTDRSQPVARDLQKQYAEQENLYQLAQQYKEQLLALAKNDEEGTISEEALPYSKKNNRK
jgi:hypothetical protein